MIWSQPSPCSTLSLDDWQNLLVIFDLRDVAVLAEPLRQIREASARSDCPGTKRRALLGEEADRLSTAVPANTDDPVLVTLRWLDIHAVNAEARLALDTSALTPGTKAWRRVDPALEARLVQEDDGGVLPQNLVLVKESTELVKQVDAMNERALRKSCGEGDGLVNKKVRGEERSDSVQR
jgi:hypothetical protein